LLGRGDIPAEAAMAPPAVREKLKEGGDRSIKHTDGEINVSIEIKCYYYRPQKVADDSPKNGCWGRFAFFGEYWQQHDQ